MCRIAAILFTLSALAWMPGAGAAGAMRCDSHIVDEGDLAVQVLSACGEPAYRDPWTLPRAGGYGGYAADSEEWYYNFGSSQLLRVVKIRNGRVVNIDSEGYGFEPTPGPSSCRPNDIVQGMSKFRLLWFCGDPVQHRAMGVLTPLRRHSMNSFYDDVSRPQVLVPVYREEWIYNFGSSYLMRVVTLENGRVSDVENDDRGFDH